MTVGDQEVLTDLMSSAPYKPHLLPFPCFVGNGRFKVEVWGSLCVSYSPISLHPLFCGNFVYGGPLCQKAHSYLCYQLNQVTFEGKNLTTGDLRAC